MINISHSHAIVLICFLVADAQNFQIGHEAAISLRLFTIVK